jgi:SRSO17 transposase
VGTTIETLATIEGHRWAIEDSFEAAKNELGLDHNETRSWHGWYRHVSLVMLAYAMMAAVRLHANQPLPKKTMHHPARHHPVLSVGQSRKSGGSQTGSPKNVSGPPS